MKTATAIQLPGVGTQANDALLDLVAEIITTAAQANRRDRNSAKADHDGLPSCEVCGLGLKTVVDCLDAGGAVVAHVGPECARKIRAKLFAIEMERTERSPFVADRDLESPFIADR